MDSQVKHSFTKFNTGPGPRTNPAIEQAVSLNPAVSDDKGASDMYDVTTSIAIFVMCATLLAMLCLVIYLVRTMMSERRKRRAFQLASQNTARSRPNIDDEPEPSDNENAQNAAPRIEDLKIERSNSMTPFKNPN